ncbi:GNAT family N-acetyltransferase [Luteimonas suaedae]|uniref:GNAT family N-acetyltransferase n=1 Tax=Luteimonas suaedae TaxID=2605430 RepID=UPI0011F01620|nr:GNAT family N-acetyltransferase [Luteimonas suaedae]
MVIRDATLADVSPLARLWFDAWQDAHAAILPEALRRIRTLENFSERLLAALGDVRVAVDSAGATLGFCIVDGDELSQLFLSAAARGTGVAAALVADAETRMAGSGVGTAWLACAIGNDRAARFYEKCGWRCQGNMTSRLPVPGGIFELEVWRYEKMLRPAREGSAVPGASSPDR